MQLENPRSFAFAVSERGHDLASLLETGLHRAAGHAETLALYVLLCAFWGLVIYEALSVIAR
jgi:hypothetical protein